MLQVGKLGLSVVGATRAAKSTSTMLYLDLRRFYITRIAYMGSNAGSNGAISPSLARAGMPSSRVINGYTSTLSNAGITKPLRKAGPRAMKVARIDGNAG